MKTKFTYPELQAGVKELSATGHKAFEEAGKELDFSKITVFGAALSVEEKIAKLKELNAKMSDYHDDLKEYEGLIKSRQLADEMTGFKGFLPKDEPAEKPREQKSLGKLFMESVAYKQRNTPAVLDVDMKTIVRTGAGWAPAEVRLPRVELYPLRSLRVADVFPTYATGEATIRYMEETTHTNNAAEIAEETNAAAPTAAGEAAIVMTERNAPIENVAVWIPVTQQQIDDVAGAEQFITDRLTYMVRNRLDGQLCAGDGNTPNIRGVLNAANVQSQAKGTDPTPDAIFKGMTKVRGVAAGTGFGEPSACLIHPNDWQDIRLLRTADGIYIFGNPTEPGMERMWGIPVVVTSAETENTAVVGDFANYAALYVKNGMEVAISDSHASLFTAFTLTIRANIRCAAVYFRGTSFCKITGI